MPNYEITIVIDSISAANAADTVEAIDRLLKEDLLHKDFHIEYIMAEED